MLTTTASCLLCGTINDSANAICAGCGGALAITSPFAQPVQTHDWEPDPDPQIPLPGIQPFTIGAVTNLTIKLFRQHLWLITKLVFFIVAPLELFKATTLATIIPISQMTAVSYLLGGVANVLIAPALVYALMKALQTGEAPGVHESFRWGLSRLGKLTVAAMTAWFLQSLGYMLCIVPGIIVSLVFTVVYPVAILEKGSLEETLSRSNQLTRGSKLEILGATICVGFLMLIVTFPLMILIEAADSAPTSVVAGIFISIAEQIMTVLSLVLYLSLSRTGKQGQLTPSSTN